MSDSDAGLKIVLLFIWGVVCLVANIGWLLTFVEVARDLWRVTR